MELPPRSLKGDGNGFLALRRTTDVCLVLKAVMHGHCKQPRKFSLSMYVRSRSSLIRSSVLCLKLLSAPLARRTQSVSKFVSFVVLAIELQLLTQPCDTLSKQRQSEQKFSTRNSRMRVRSDEL